MQWLLCAYHIGQDIEAAYEIATIYEYGTYDTMNELMTMIIIMTLATGIPMDLDKAIDYLHLRCRTGTRRIDGRIGIAL